MTLDSFSEIILALVCVWIFVQAFKVPNTHAGIGLAALLIGIAAVLGIVKFSSFTEASLIVSGAHKFASLVASVAAFPILAYSLANPSQPFAMRLAGAWWLTFICGGFGVAIVVLGFKPWAQIVPALCALWIGYTVLFTAQGRSTKRILGFVALLLSFAATLLIKPEMQLLGFLSKTQLLHYFLAIALFLLTQERLKQKTGNIV